MKDQMDEVFPCKCSHNYNDHDLASEDATDFPCILCTVEGLDMDKFLAGDDDEYINKFEKDKRASNGYCDTYRPDNLKYLLGKYEENQGK